MLFVDHDHTETRELDTLLDERVSTDHDVDRPVGESGENVTTSLPRDAVGEEFDANLALTEEIVVSGDA
jgi:hypothetical protein